jgi:hypothetical protein
MRREQRRGDRVSEIGKRLAGDELEAFLQQGLIARLACLDDDGWPYNVAVWHHWDGEVFWVISTEKAIWSGYLERNPRVALLIDDLEPLRRVMCQGEAVLVESKTTDGQWQPIARRMGERYLGEGVDAYEAASAGLKRSLFKIIPRKIVAWEGAGRTER